MIVPRPGLEADAVLAVSGQLEVRLTSRAEEIDAAAALRYDVFYREMGATPTPEMAASGRDIDRYDAACDHMLVIDTAIADPLRRVVGYYRLLRGEMAARFGGFYSAGEYDIADMIARAGPEGRLLELGRSAVRESYRTGPVMQALWRGLVVYLARHGITLMFGCASFPGTDPATHLRELAYLHHWHLMPEPRVRARPELFVAMDRLPREGVNAAEALRELPPLIRGYVRTGAYVGEGAVIDRQFRTTDVLIYFPVSRIDPRWLAHLSRKRGSDRLSQ